MNKKTTYYKHLLLTAYKPSGAFTEEEKRELRRRVEGKLLDCATATSTAVDCLGCGVLNIFDLYAVEELSLFKRFRHALRVFSATVAGNIGINPVVIIVGSK